MPAMSGIDLQAYAVELGKRLRSVRQELRFSLAAVEHQSKGVFKAVVIGSYERGDRAVTVSRLAALAAFYDVPVAYLLPPTDEAAPTTPAGRTAEARRLLHRATDLLNDTEDVAA
jgi:transcriptional regulator with XRE-family HTH domain